MDRPKSDYESDNYHSLLFADGSEWVEELMKDNARVESVIDTGRYFQTVQGITPIEMVGIMTGKNPYDLSEMSDNIFTEAEIKEIIERQKSGQDMGLSISNSNFFFTQDEAGKIAGIVVFNNSIHKLTSFGSECAGGSRFFSKKKFK